jgi:nitrite reductase/ring-hydroxylating ferredoxin subunit
MTAVDINGRSILIVNVKGNFCAIGNVCTLMGCYLSDGTLKEENVQCPCHGSIFDVRTGALVKGPAKEPEMPFNWGDSQILKSYPYTWLRQTKKRLKSGKSS